LGLGSREIGISSAARSSGGVASPGIAAALDRPDLVAARARGDDDASAADPSVMPTRPAPHPGSVVRFVIGKRRATSINHGVDPYQDR